MPTTRQQVALYAVHCFMKRILIVDDDHGTVVGFRGLLQPRFDVSAAHKGADALVAATNEHFDLALVDVRLPDMSGLEVAMGFRRLAPMMPIIAVTGFATTDTVVQALRLRIDDFIEKPIFEDALMAAVARHIHSDWTDVIRPSDNVDAPAADRWARAVVPLVRCKTDPKTLDGWSQLIAASKGAIKNWCVTAGIRPKDSLRFARLLRATILLSGGGVSLENCLDAVDKRTIAKLCTVVGVPLDKKEHFPDPDEFFRLQRIIRDPQALAALRRELFR